MRIRIVISLLLVVGIAGFYSCVDEVSYPVEPSLELGEIGVIKYSTEDLTEYDSALVLVMQFTDGDGDLGVNPPEFDTTNMYYDIFTMKNKELEKLEDIQPARIPFLPVSSSQEYLKGTIQYTLDLTLFDFVEGIELDTIKISLHIEDRAYNKSNVVETPVLIMNPKPKGNN